MKPKKEGTERLAFSGEGARERALSEFRRLRREGYAGVARYTDQIGNKMVYVVAYPIAEDLAAVEQVLNQSTIDSPTEF